eukprot:Blabericola_migrator_1__13533@NODE_98_length_14373_cov_122_493220_g88_i0_p9_GENE_NODE_98_length_14373_cov_122_493220_g88_i0NODE_98_length_14373_cov_122_493220_g88_i0_p9_ORF_typecomplete_len178_score52_51AAA_13/PF13166_6/0_0018Fez1/PF06818_15/6_5e02Fez1/PF06818_15/0_012HrpE/PF06188_12/0_032DUF438/PF04282_13/1e03DUF438/PF04282_13/0_034ATG16/PF08614_11/0_063Cep57_CLD_2/PF14197_6/6_6Cep57_CLD_2/PF14197_6/0_14FAM76/PF16046_5/0_11DUF16/PF01519_16/0_19HAP1_N/PF04849_13/0_51Mitofilin/PF09731_9/1_1Exonuc
MTRSKRTVWTLRQSESQSGSSPDLDAEFPSELTEDFDEDWAEHVAGNFKHQMDCFNELIKRESAEEKAELKARLEAAERRAYDSEITRREARDTHRRDMEELMTQFTKEFKELYVDEIAALKEKLKAQTEQLMANAEQITKLKKERKGDKRAINRKHAELKKTQFSASRMDSKDLTL